MIRVHALVVSPGPLYTRVQMSLMADGIPRYIESSGRTPQMAMNNVIKEFIDRIKLDYEMDRWLVAAFGEDALH